MKLIVRAAFSAEFEFVSYLKCSILLVFQYCYKLITARVIALKQSGSPITTI